MADVQKNGSLLYSNGGTFSCFSQCGSRCRCAFASRVKELIYLNSNIHCKCWRLSNRNSAFICHRIRIWTWITTVKGLPGNKTFPIFLDGKLLTQRMKTFGNDPTLEQKSWSLALVASKFIAVFPQCHNISCMMNFYRNLLETVTHYLLRATSIPLLKLGTWRISAFHSHWQLQHRREDSMNDWCLPRLGGTICKQQQQQEGTNRRCR